jgi:hypothetical protein
MGLNPTILRQSESFAFVFSSLKLPASPRRNYRASGFVLTSRPDLVGGFCAVVFPPFCDILQAAGYFRRAWQARRLMTLPSFHSLAPTPSPILIPPACQGLVDALGGATRSALAGP